MFFVIYIYKSEPGTQANDHQDINATFYKGLRLEGKFVRKNVFNLSRRNLSPPEIFLLSKLCLTWHFQNDEQTFTTEKFRPRSSFNPRNKDDTIETYLSCLEERLLGIDIPSKRYNNLTKDERDALYSLKDDPSIIIKVLTKVLLLLSGTEKIT